MRKQYNGLSYATNCLSYSTVDSSRRSSVLLLALAGFISALLLIVAPLHRYLGDFPIGFYFGATLAIYFWVREKYRNPIKIALFILACAFAYIASWYTAMELYGLFPGEWSLGSRLEIPAPVFLGAGFVGSFLVFCAGFFVFGPKNLVWRSIGRALLWSSIGGLLGAVGGELDSRFTRGTSRELWILFFTWQPSVAALLGFLLNRERRLSSARSAQPIPGAVQSKGNYGLVAASQIFFAVIVCWLGIFIYRNVERSRESARLTAVRDEAYKKLLAEAPPVEELPPVIPMAPEKALIVREIGGRYPWLPMASESTAYDLPHAPHTVNYWIGYTTAKDPPPYQVQRTVAVSVTQLPNAEWAYYRSKYPATNVAIDSPQTLIHVIRFGQVVVQDTHMRYPDGGGTLCFHWPSGNFAVSVCYETKKVDEEFLREYLTEYPSSLS